MSREAPEILIARHEAFLRLAPVERPLLGFWRGGYYPGEQFPRGTASWREGRPLEPGDVTFGDFAADYEVLYRLHREADDDFFYVGSAYWGIPWMEAILGCPVTVAGLTSRAEPCPAGPGDAGAGPLDGNPWFRALADFTRDLVSFAADRFPVALPLLRGPGDCASAVMGGLPWVMSLHDEPAEAASLLARCANARAAVVRALQALIPPWRGTRAAGGYPSKVWCRESVAYHQEDSAALLNPVLFRTFLLPLHEEACRAADVNFIHLHSSCLYPVDIFAGNRCHAVVEINIDHPGGSSPPVDGLLPTLRKIQSARWPLLLWGELTPAEWGRLRSELSPVGLSLQPVVRTGEGMQAWQEVLR